MLNFNLARLSEPSTWAGFAAFLSAYSVQAPDAWKTWLLVASGVCGGLAVFLSEKGAPLSQITADVLKAVNDGMNSNVVKKVAVLGLLGLSLTACSPDAIARFNASADKAVIDGQIFCAKATVAGPLVVALADMSGAPISVIGRTAGTVQALCASISGMPVSPPPMPAQAPVVAAPVTVGK